MTIYETSLRRFGINVVFDLLSFDHYWSLDLGLL